MWEVILESLAENFDKFFFGIITITIVSAFLMDIRDKNYPPFPMGLPFFGYIPMLNSKAPYLTLTELAQQYGRVFGVKFGGMDAVILADVKLIKEALGSDRFTSLPPLRLTHGTKTEKGLTGAEGETWKEHRNFVSTVFKDMGRAGGAGAKVVLEQKILESVKDFVRDLQEGSGEGQEIYPPLSRAVGLLLLEIVVGNRYDKDHPDWKILQAYLDESSRFDSVTGLLNYIPWLKRLSSYAKTWTSLLAGREKSLKIYRNFMEKQSKSLNPSNIRCVVDAYLVEVQKREEEGRVGTFTKEQINQVMADLIGAGLDTTLTTLKWLYLYMAIYPDVQEKVAEEVAAVTGKKREVTLSDLEQLPYTEATVMEIWRHRSIIPLGVPHFTKEKTKIGEYIIEKDSMVVPLLWAVHHDPRLWEKPDIFSPERFLHEDGTVFRNDNLIPFQTGKRACIGEEVGRWAVQLFFANTVNQFQIDLPKGFAYNFEEAPECGTTLTPRPYQLLLSNRH